MTSVIYAGTYPFLLLLCLPCAAGALPHLSGSTIPLKLAFYKMMTKSNSMAKANHKILYHQILVFEGRLEREQRSATLNQQMCNVSCQFSCK